jgi:hypothetical protein
MVLEASESEWGPTLLLDELDGGAGEVNRDPFQRSPQDDSEAIGDEGRRQPGTGTPSPGRGLDGVLGGERFPGSGRGRSQRVVPGRRSGGHDASIQDRVEKSREITKITQTLARRDDRPQS